MLGKHLQAGPGGEDIGAYLFQRIVPRERLVRWCRLTLSNPHRKRLGLSA